MMAGWSLIAGFMILVTDLEVGVATRSITPEIGPRKPTVYLAGFGTNRVARGVFGEIEVRTALFRRGKTEVALASVDVVGLFLEEIEAIREELIDRGVLNVVTFVCATHTHAGPDTMGLWGPVPWVSGASPGYLRRVRKAVVETILEARSKARPAKLKATTVNVSDRIRDTRSPQVIDPTMHVLSVESGAGIIATLVQVSVHPEVLYGDNRVLCADFPYFLRRDIDLERGGTTLYFSGAVGGLMTPRAIELLDPETGRKAPRGSIRNCELYGTDLARRVLDSLDGSVDVAVTGLKATTYPIAIPVENWRFGFASDRGIVGRRLHDGCVRSEVGLIDFGDLQMVAVPGEVYPELWIEGGQTPPDGDYDVVPDLPPLRNLMTGRFAVILGLANDELGYIIPPGQWDEVAPFAYGRETAPYGEYNSVGPQAAIRIFEGVRALTTESFR